MTLAFYGVIVASALIFVVSVVARAIRYARAPIHLRWEIYPIPHESPLSGSRHRSRYEETDWWTRPVANHRASTAAASLAEILTFTALRQNNRPLWRRSYLFHAGLYLLAATIVLLLAAAAATLVAPPFLRASGWGRTLAMSYRVTGMLGAAFTFAGALGLLHRRWTDTELRIYSAPGDFFNLGFFIVAVGLLGIGYLVRPPQAASVLTIVTGLLRWDTSVRVPGLLGAGLVLSAVLVAYIPFTHMSHFVAKFFTYHDVRWDDALAKPGGTIERKVAEQLKLRPTWSARHVEADGVRSWLDIASNEPKQGAGR